MNNTQESSPNILQVTLFLMLFFSMTDFFIYISPAIILFILAAVFIVGVLRRVEYKIKNHILIYFFISSSLFLINTAFSSEYNFLMFTPLIAWCFILNQKKFTSDSLDKGIKILCLAFVLVAVMEMAVKIASIQIPLYNSFIEHYGDKRIDVLRARTVFGSSLSTAALCIFFIFYFTRIRYSSTYLILTFILVLMSGSRTAVVLSLLLLIFTKLFRNRFFMEFKKLRIIHILSLSILVCGAIVVWGLSERIGISHIFLRAVTVEIDASFLGRANTTGSSFEMLISGLPETLFIGLDKKYISDSAFISIASESGIIALYAFSIYLFMTAHLSHFSFNTQIIFFITCVLGGLVIGDFFVPPITFLYFLTMFTIEHNRQYTSLREWTNKNSS